MRNKIKPADKKLIFDYLSSHKMMALAVVDGKKPWVATVYYVVGKDLGLYCLTGPKTEHGQAIVKNKNVACNVADTAQKVTDKKVGMQIQGTISRVKGPETIRWMLKMWPTRLSLQPPSQKKRASS